VSRGALCSFMFKTQSFTKTMFNCVLHIQPFFLLTCNRVYTESCSRNIPFCRSVEALTKSQHFGFCLSCFPWRHTLWRITECIGIFLNGSFPPICTRRTKGYFYGIYCLKHIQLLEIKFTKVWLLMTRCHGAFVSWTTHTKSIENF
jgi:hypothetical protein